MQIPVQAALTKIGLLTLQVDILTAEVSTLKDQIKLLESVDDDEPDEDPGE